MLPILGSAGGLDDPGAISDQRRSIVMLQKHWSKCRCGGVSCGHDIRERRNLGSVTGKRDELVAHLTRRSTALKEAGCLLYEVGVSVEDPDTVFVIELWNTAEAHRASLQL